MALDRASSLQCAALGTDFGTSGNVATSQTPHRLRCSFRGIVPPGVDGALLFYMIGWGVGSVALFTRYGSNQLECTIGRGEAGEGGFYSTVMRKPGVEQLLEVEWRDMPGADGGHDQLLHRRQAGGRAVPHQDQAARHPEMDFSGQCRGSGNMRQAIDVGLLVRELSIAFDKPVIDYSYPPVASGPVKGEVLPDLVVDARAVTAPQPPATLAWRGPDGSVGTLDIGIGPLAVPLGHAYKAVLEDWSSGQGVAHPNMLVMTRIGAQNCRFEDAWLGSVQPAWIECLPRDRCPISRASTIAARRSAMAIMSSSSSAMTGTRRLCRPIRSGHLMASTATWSRTNGRSTIAPTSCSATIEISRRRPAQQYRQALPVRGKYRWARLRDDQQGSALVSASAWCVPGIIWRSGDPGSQDPAGIRRTVPLFDLSVPFGCHVDYSVNGFDLRIFMGGQGNEGQANGFGNVRVIPWRQSDYGTMVGNAGHTRDPYDAWLYSANSMAANAALWLEDTPFNVQGRSPITGSGGMRDDRQIIAEPVAWHINMPDGARPHDGTPWRTIALDYLTGYVTDPGQAFEKGRNVPLFKGTARRSIALRNQYYGPGNLALPEAQAWYQQGGRVSSWLRGTGPLTVSAPDTGDTPNTPYFGTFQIDKLHGHQFPGWGSLLFRTPEFAFLGHRFWDQNRLYSNDIIGDGGPDLWASREGAWAFLHAALAWKTASAGSQRLYSRRRGARFRAIRFRAVP